jgi:hypothetical protein
MPGPRVGPLGEHLIIRVSGQCYQPVFSGAVFGMIAEIILAAHMAIGRLNATRRLA